MLAGRDKGRQFALKASCLAKAGVLGRHLFLERHGFPRRMEIACRLRARSRKLHRKRVLRRHVPAARDRGETAVVLEPRITNPDHSRVLAPTAPPLSVYEQVQREIDVVNSRSKMPPPLLARSRIQGPPGRARTCGEARSFSATRSQEENSGRALFLPPPPRRAKNLRKHQHAVARCDPHHGVKSARQRHRFSTDGFPARSAASDRGRGGRGHTEMKASTFGRRSTHRRTGRANPSIERLRTDREDLR